MTRKKIQNKVFNRLGSLEPRDKKVIDVLIEYDLIVNAKCTNCKYFRDESQFMCNQLSNEIVTMPQEPFWIEDPNEFACNNWEEKE